ncbi:ABC transporter ATP-binding protein [Georgenia sp. Z1491]|uniref:ABC transporter ATP-binding protein n=1 Tax=Georgenia sp. Z1491 TaxID=3416707 RepID=UPI003CFAB72E
MTPTTSSTAPDRHSAAPATDAVIEAVGLRRSYGSRSERFEAVRGIDLTVHRGELFALLGTNGAGKTSTLEVLEGLGRASAGTVRVLDGDPVADRARIRPRTGVLLQEGGFVSELTVADTARSWHGTLPSSIGPEAALSMVELDHRADVRVPSLSGGERRRLDLALALMGDPELLFLDEPTAGLDPQSRAVLWDIVRARLASGTTVVLTTHYLEEAESLADRIAIMHGGEIVREGTLAQIVADEPERISFTTAGTEDLPVAGLPHLLARPSTAAGRTVLETHDLQATLTALLTAAAQAGVRIDNLDARHASLEQVFLAIAGSELDQAAAA